MPNVKAGSCETMHKLSSDLKQSDNLSRSSIKQWGTRQSFQDKWFIPMIPRHESRCMTGQWFVVCPFHQNCD